MLYHVIKILHFSIKFFLENILMSFKKLGINSQKSTELGEKFDPEATPFPRKDLAQTDLNGFLIYYYMIRSRTLSS